MSSLKSSSMVSPKFLRHHTRVRTPAHDSISKVIHALSRWMALVSRTVLSSGGIWPEPRVAVRVSFIECSSEPGAMTRLLVSPRLLFSSPLMMPDCDKGVVMRVSQPPSAVPPG